jgi:hypothetical protein
MHMHGWWIPFIIGAGMMVHNMDKAHIVHTSDPKDNSSVQCCNNPEKALATSALSH